MTTEVGRTSRIPKTALEALFTEARTHQFFSEKEVPLDSLESIYDMAKFAPTASNCCPMRLVFATSPEAKAKVSATLMPGNVAKVATAPVVVIVAYDMAFYEHLPKLAPHMPVPSKYASSTQAELEEVALRNASLQAGFLILAARAHGLDCGPMSGFRKHELDAAFFKESTWRTNFLLNLGYGTGERLHERAERLSLDDACVFE